MAVGREEKQSLAGRRGRCQSLLGAGLSEALHDEIIEGLVHPQIGAFSHFAQSKIDAGDRDAFGKICEMFLQLFDDAAPG